MKAETEAAPERAGTRERILYAALRLFARDGYEAASVRDIADCLSMTKAALYKHYKSKRDIFDCILERMRLLDAERARAYDLPERTAAETPEAYARATLDRVKAFSEAQFRYWTEEEFPSCFRRLLTLEQYRSPEMAALYRQYLSDGPLSYVEELFSGISGSAVDARRLALEFYGPIFLLYSVYDGSEDKKAVTARLCGHIERFKAR